MIRQSPGAAARSTMDWMASRQSTMQPGLGLSRTAILAMVAVAVAAASGMAFGFATSLLLHLPSPATVPDCPAGTSLYTRTVLVGKVLLPIQHCFREGDALDQRP